MAKQFRRVTKKTKKEWTAFKRRTTIARKEFEKLREENLSEYKSLQRFAKMMGKNIKKARTLAKMSLEELSERADLPLDYLKEMEAGKINSYITDSLSIAYVLKIEHYILYKD